MTDFEHGVRLHVAEVHLWTFVEDADAWYEAMALLLAERAPA